MRQNTKVPFILCIIATLLAVLFFILYHYYQYFFWVGVTFGIIAVICLLWGLTYFLRSRSVTSGLLIVMTTLTVIYAATSHILNANTPVILTATVNGAENLNAAANIFTPVVLLQIGLFIIWFLLTLFVVYIYIRPLKKIDQALAQIIAANNIDKLNLGKGIQYQNIAAKLKILAATRYKRSKR